MREQGISEKITVDLLSTLQGYAKLLVSPFRSATPDLSRIAHAKEPERGSTCYDAATTKQGNQAVPSFQSCQWFELHIFGLTRHSFSFLAPATRIMRRTLVLNWWQPLVNSALRSYDNDGPASGRSLIWAMHLINVAKQGVGNSAMRSSGCA